jgi:hypothetical protein
VKSILGSDNQKEGYLVSSVADKLGEKIQDSPKEDFIFCSECEAKFSIIERYVANAFYNKYNNPSFLSEFPVVKGVDDGFDVMLAENVNPIMFKLFIYSLLWRASISSHPVFSTFKLKATDAENLRMLLNAYLHSNEAVMSKFCDKNAMAFEHLPFNIVTTLAPIDTTANMIAPFDAGDNKVLLFANEFMIVIYLDWNAPDTGALPFNLGEQQVCIGIVSAEDWQGFHSNPVSMLVDSRLSNFGTQ